MNRLQSRTLLMLALVGVLALQLAAIAQKTSQSADVLFESARQKELVEGKLEEAIQIYTRIVQEHASNRPLAAKALLHIGQCHERLGQAEARSAYERLVRDFADQKDTVAEARDRLAALGQPAGAGKSGVTVRQVWAGGNVEDTGSPTADGRALAVTDWQTGDVAMRDVATGNMRRVTTTGDVMQSGAHALFATLSPDDKRIAYAWFDPKSMLYEMRLIGVDGSGGRTLYREEGGWVLPLAWSPDGRHVIAIVDLSRSTGVKQIVLVSAVNGAVQVLKASSKDPLPDKISMSPDGRYLVYDLLQADGRRDIFLLAVKDRRELRLVGHPADDGVPLWTPDGRRVVFVSDRTGNASLWAVEVVDGKAVSPPELLKADVGPGYLPMGFTRNGSLYYGLAASMIDVYVATLDLQAGRVIERPATISQRNVGANRTPAWSPDGRYLAFTVRRGPSMAAGAAVRILALDTGQERDIQVDASAIRRLAWFPDGSALLLNARDEQRRWALLRIDVKTGAVSALVRCDPSAAAVEAGVARGGKTLVYLLANDATQARAIVARDLQTNEERTIPLPSLSPTGLAVSPDGERLAVVVTDSPKHTQMIVVMPVAGGEPREICRFDKVGTIVGQPAWTPDGKQIVFGGRPEQKIEFLSVSSEGGEVRRAPLPMEGITDFSIHPDGKRIAFSAGQSKSEVWVIENFLPPAKKGT